MIRVRISFLSICSEHSDHCQLKETVRILVGIRYASGWLLLLSISGVQIKQHGLSYEQDSVVHLHVSYLIHWQTRNRLRKGNLILKMIYSLRIRRIFSLCDMIYLKGWGGFYWKRHVLWTQISFKTNVQYAYLIKKNLMVLIEFNCKSHTSVSSMEMLCT